MLRDASVLQKSKKTHNPCCLQVGYIDDRFGPLGLATVVVLALTAILVLSLVDFAEQLRSGRQSGGPPPPALGGPASLRRSPAAVLRALDFPPAFA